MSGIIDVKDTRPCQSVVALKITAPVTPEARELIQKIQNNSSSQSLYIDLQLNGDNAEIEIPYLMLG